MSEDLRNLVIEKALDAVRLAGERTGYARKGFIRAQFLVIAAKYPVLSGFRDLFLQTAGIR